MEPAMSGPPYAQRVRPVAHGTVRVSFASLYAYAKRS